MNDFGLELERNGRLEEAHSAFSYTPVRDESGEISGLFGACIEITDSIALRAGEARLRDNDRRKDEFLATPAHALRVEPVDVARLVESALETTAPAVKKAGCTARISPPPVPGRGAASRSPRACRSRQPCSRMPLQRQRSTPLHRRTTMSDVQLEVAGA